MIATVPVQAATTPEFKVGDLLEVKDVRGSKSTSFLATIESAEEGVYTLMLSDGIALEGTAENLIRWGYKRLWSIGDKVTPKRSRGSRYGTITGFNIKKKAPLLVKFDSYKVESQMAKDAVVLASGDEPSEAIADKPATVGKIIPDPEDQELGDGELKTAEFTIALSNGMEVQVKADEWGEGTIQLDFHGAISTSGFRSDHWEGELSDVSGYAQQKAQELFDELPKDCDGHPLFTGDRCEVIKGQHKGLIDEVVGLYEGRLYFRDDVLKRGFFAPDRLRRVEQGEISLKVLGVVQPTEETADPVAEFKPATHYSEGDWVTGLNLSKQEFTGQVIGYSHSGMLRVDVGNGSDRPILIDPATAQRVEAPESSLATVEESKPAIDPRTQLVDEINQLSGQLEEAQEVAESADRSALQFAKEIGDRLLALKPQVEHGEWEAFREANIKSPRTGKPMASSTATLCQRVAKRWAELQEQGIESLKQASLTLRKPQQIEQAKSATVADLPEAELESTATIEQPEINLEEVERRGELIGDLVPPTWGELKSLYSQLGKVSGWGSGIAVESERLAFSAIFQTREEAWEKWQKKYKPALDRLANPQTGQTTGQELPETFPLNDSTPDNAIANSDDPYAYREIPACPVTFSYLGNKQVEGLAIGVSQTMVKIQWGDSQEHETCVPKSAVTWDDEPGIMAAGGLVEAGLYVASDREIPVIQDLEAAETDPVAEVTELVSHYGLERVLQIVQLEAKTLGVELDEHPAGILASAESCEHYTPEEIWKPGLECFGVEEFDLDPSTYPESPIPTRQRFTRKEDGLSQQWIAETLWSNFPYSDRDPETDKKQIVMHKWVSKLCAEVDAGNVKKALTLVKCDCRAAWFHELLETSTAHAFIRGAVKFERPSNKGEQKPNGSFFGSVIFYFGDEVDRFYHAYSPIAAIGQLINPEMFGE